MGYSPDAPGIFLQTRYLDSRLTAQSEYERQRRKGQEGGVQDEAMRSILYGEVKYEIQDRAQED